jgi:hypothetical protein
MRKIGLVILGLSLALSTSQSNAADKSFTTIQKAIDSLKVADEVRSGYVRTKFKHWITISRPGQIGCDSRKSVIIDEAMVKPTIGKGCSLAGGEWFSIYDNIKVTDAGKLDVDHMVPLAEAWDSGASSWNDLRRQQYANDMVDPRHLIAVTGASNRSKSDQDPSDWLPTNKDYVCTYLANWVEIKVRWQLSVDKKEKDAILTSLKSCKATKLVVTPITN